MKMRTMAQVRKPRKYLAIWERIKAEKRCTIKVLPVLVARVKKAVIKEKDMDLGFKLLNSERILQDRIYLDIQYDTMKQHMTFVLRQSIGLEAIRV